MEKDFIYKNRSFSSCLLAAYKLMGDNMKGILRSTWLPVLLCGVFSGMFITTNIRLPEVQEFGQTHPALFLSIYGVSLLGMTVCSLWAYSRLLSMLNERGRRWNLLRMLKLGLCLTIIIAISSGLIGGALVYLALRQQVELPVFLADNWLVLSLALIVYAIVLLPLNYQCMRYLLSGEARFFPDFTKSYATGFRHIGFIFITMLLTDIITAVVGGIISLPFLILVVAQTFSAVGVVNGDPSGMPGYFAALHGATYGLTTMLLMYVMMFSILVNMFMYGSIEQQRKERRKTVLATPELSANSSTTSSLSTPFTTNHHATDYSHPNR